MPREGRAVKESRDPPKSPESTSQTGVTNGKTLASNGAHRSLAVSSAVGAQDAGKWNGASILESDSQVDERSELGEEARLFKELAVIDRSKRIEMLRVQLEEAREDGPVREVREGLCCLQKFRDIEAELAETKTRLEATETQLREAKEAKESEEVAHDSTKAQLKEVKEAKHDVEEAYRTTVAQFKEAYSATMAQLKEAREEKIDEEKSHNSTKVQLKETREERSDEEKSHNTTRAQLREARKMNNDLEEAYSTTRAQLKEAREAKNNEEKSHNSTKAQLKEAREAKIKEVDAHDVTMDELEKMKTRLAAEVERRRRLTFRDVELPGNGRFGDGFPRQRGDTTLLDPNHKISPNGRVAPWKP